jgi:hypothetical protein
VKFGTFGLLNAELIFSNLPIKQKSYFSNNADSKNIYDSRITRADPHIWKQDVAANSYKMQNRKRNMYLNFETSNTFFSFILVCTREETVLNLKLFLSFFFSINLNKLLIWQVIVKILVVNPVQKE